VVSIARRHVGRAPCFFEIVSDGNLSLMRAVEKFDYARGFKFSTYASWAIMRNYARTIPEQMYQSARLVTGVDEALAATPDRTDTAGQGSARPHSSSFKKAWPCLAPVNATSSSGIMGCSVTAPHDSGSDREGLRSDQGARPTD